jgi:hypothetical protein
MLRTSLPLPLMLVMATGCTNILEKPFRDADGDGGTDTSVDTADTGRDTSDTSDTGRDTSDTSDTGRDTSDTSDTGGDTSDTGSSGASELDVPGDVVTFEEGGEQQSVDLADASGDSNEGQEFYLLLVNTGGSDVGYELRYRPGEAAARPSPAPARVPARVTPARVGAASGTRPARATPPPPPPLEDADVGSARDEFLVRDDLYDTESFSVVNARLWALGENVAIWVDEDLPIDWDVDCDGTVDVPDRFEAYGFDNCDLSTVADIIDGNIVPNVRALYGDESDIDSDGRVSVVITPVLNAITLTSSDESDFTSVLPGYAEPSVDLQTYSSRTNPGSDEAEVVYVFAPDPYGFFNPNTAPTVEDYTSFQLAAEVARSFTTLVTYNQKVLVGESSSEEDWLNDALGSFAADYCGFGANFYEDAWDYLDAPHLAPLVRESDPGNLGTLARGAQFLYARWLYDAAERSAAGSGLTLMNSIVQRADVGVDAVGAATEEVLGLTFAQSTVAWQLALLTTGQVDGDGLPLVDPDTWAPYADAVIIDAPPDDPRGFYGAHGYQSGLNILGFNRVYTGGTTTTPEELTARAVRLGNVDTMVYAPGFEFQGFISGNYGAQVVRLVGPTFATSSLEIEATGEGVVGMVVRWNDPTTPDWSIEDSFSAADTNAIPLPALPTDGRPIYGVGRISEVGSTYVIDESGDETSAEVVDSDRWLLDLRDRPVGTDVHVVAWLDRRFSNTSGAIGLSDPWLAIVPEEYVPLPTVTGTTSGACADGYAFAYPTSVLSYLYGQVFLSSTLVSGNEDAFDACGSSSGSTTCDEDWDRDGVLDSNEPAPTSFLGQVRVMECTANGNVAPSAYEVGDDNLDVDELDSDDTPTYSYYDNTGGRNGDEGEEAYVDVTLEGGRTYLVVVGAAAGDGAYELTLREMTE